MNEAIKFEQIHSYLSGELSGTALTEFEAQMKSDPALKAEVELHRDIDIALMDDTKIPFIQSINKIHKANQEAPVVDVKPPGILRRRILRYAGVAVAAVLLGVFVLPRLIPSETPMQISENTIGNAFLLDTKRSISDGSDVTKEVGDINQKIIAGQYAEAIPLLNEFYSQTGDNNAALSLGYCHLQVKNYDNAIAVLKEVSAKKSDEKDTAMWYLAHSYLRKGEKSTAEDILKQLIQYPKTAINRSKQAKNLLNSIENIN